VPSDEAYTKRPSGEQLVTSCWQLGEYISRVGVLFKDETAWLTQKTMAELFGVGVPAISKHLKNIFESGELDAQATSSKMETVRSEGGRGRSAGRALQPTRSSPSATV